MENNKFNKFYSKKSVIDLIEQIRSHRIKGNTMDKDWYEALIKHLSERDITDEVRKKVDHILSANPEILKNDEEQFAIEMKRLKEITFNSSNISLKKSGINAAGKSLKNIVYAVILLILFTTIGVFLSVSLKDPETIKYTYLFLGIVSLICNISILYNLYSAGDHLENS
jgi:tRNA(Ser,Leu) C12 N-acetylase TAN1